MVKHLKKKIERNNEDLRHLKVKADTETCVTDLDSLKVSLRLMHYFIVTSRCRVGFHN